MEEEYFHNIFTSIKLLEHIKERGHGATENVRCDFLEKCPLTNSKVFLKLPLFRKECENFRGQVERQWIGVQGIK